MFLAQIEHLQMIAGKQSECHKVDVPFAVECL